MKKIHILLFSILLAVCCVVSASAAGFGSNNHGGGFGDGSHGGFGGSSHGGGFSGTTSNQGTGSGSSTPGYVSKPSYSENNIPARFYEDVNFYIKLINERLSIANGYLSNIGWLLIDARTYLANIDSILLQVSSSLSDGCRLLLAGSGCRYQDTQVSPAYLSHQAKSDPVFHRS